MADTPVNTVVAMAAETSTGQTSANLAASPEPAMSAAKPAKRTRKRPPAARPPGDDESIRLPPSGL
jgi:hypothetical protein